MADVTPIVRANARHREMLTGDTLTTVGASGNSLRPGIMILGRLLTANLNSTADQAIAMGSASYMVTQIVATNVSADLSLSVAAGGIYTAAAKGGSAIVAASQVYTALTAGTVVMPLTVALTTTRFTATTTYLSLTTAHGSAATADVYVLGVAFDG